MPRRGGRSTYGSPNQFHQQVHATVSNLCIPHGIASFASPSETEFECDLQESRVSAFEKRGPRQASETRRGGGTKSVVQRAKQATPRHARKIRSQKEGITARKTEACQLTKSSIFAAKHSNSWLFGKTMVYACMATQRIASMYIGRRTQKMYRCWYGQGRGRIRGPTFRFRHVGTRAAASKIVWGG